MSKIECIEDINECYYESILIQNSTIGNVYDEAWFKDIITTDFVEKMVKFKDINNDELLNRVLNSLSYFMIETLPQVVLEYIIQFKQKLLMIEDYGLIAKNWNKYIIKELSHKVKNFELVVYDIVDVELRTKVFNLTYKPTKVTICDCETNVYDSGQGNYYYFAIDINNNFYYWNDSGNQELDNVIEGKFISVTSGVTHLCAIDIDGKLHCWGNNLFGQCSPPEGKFVMISCGNEHSVAIDVYGKLHYWGLVPNGQHKTVPEGKFISVKCGVRHTVAIDDKGKIHSWGCNSKRQLVDIPEGIFNQVSCADHYSCAIDAGGNLEVWGYNQHHSSKGKFVSVDCGRYHSCVVDDKGTLFAWGDNKRGQCDTSEGNFVMVSCGDWHTVAIDDNGKLHYWGFVSSEKGKSIPDGKFIYIFCHSNRSFAVDTDGKLHYWINDLRENKTAIYNKKFKIM